MSSRKSMFLVLSIVALTGGVCVGQPAQAFDVQQFLNFLRGDRRNQAEIDRLTAQVSGRLEQARAEGRLTGRKYSRLQKELDMIRADREQLAYEGLNWAEAQSLRNRLISLDNRAAAEIRQEEIAGRANRYWY